MNTAITTHPPPKRQRRLPEPPKQRLRDDFADWMRARNYARNTISAYVADVLDFVIFSGKRDPRGMGAVEVQKFLTMANESRINSPSHLRRNATTRGKGHQIMKPIHKTRLLKLAKYLLGLVRHPLQPVESNGSDSWRSESAFWYERANRQAQRLAVERRAALDEV